MIELFDVHCRFIDVNEESLISVLNFLAVSLFIIIRIDYRYVSMFDLYKTVQGNSVNLLKVKVSCWVSQLKVVKMYYVVLILHVRV